VTERDPYEIVFTSTARRGMNWLPLSAATAMFEHLTGETVPVLAHGGHVADVVPSYDVPRADGGRSRWIGSSACARQAEGTRDVIGKPRWRSR
jgi:hypothetical protein